LGRRLNQQARPAARLSQPHFAETKSETRAARAAAHAEAAAKSGAAVSKAAQAHAPATYQAGAWSAAEDSAGTDSKTWGTYPRFAKHAQAATAGDPEARNGTLTTWVAW